jgi:hypothetical protein
MSEKPALAVVEAISPANPDVVAKLENWLERAKSGELQSVALAAICADGASVTAWSGTIKARGYATQQSTLGAIEILRGKIMKQLLQE